VTGPGEEGVTVAFKNSRAASACTFPEDFLLASGAPSTVWAFIRQLDRSRPRFRLARHSLPIARPAVEQSTPLLRLR
jgi:hypothetical protein